jgi:type IV pilus assembly protein PilQ
LIFIIAAFACGNSYAAVQEAPDASTGASASQTKEVKPQAAASPADAAVQEPAAGPAAQAPAQPKEEKKEEAPVKVEPGNVTVNFKGADIKTVLAYISEVAGVDIVPAPDVKGVVDLKLTNKPWKTALDIIVRNYGFAYEREGDIIRVVTVDKLKQEELTTQTFALNYSKAKDVVAALKDIVGERGKVMYDERTNTVLVTDIPTSIYKIGQIVSRLDKRTEQVLIEARILEATLGDDERLGIDWNIKITATGAKRPTTIPFASLGNTGLETVFGNMNPYSQVTTASGYGAETNSGVAASSAAIAIPPADFPTDTAGYTSFPFALKDNFTFGTLDFTQFQAVLEMLKQRADTTLISDPRIATLNNTQALINVGTTLNMPTYERNSSTGKMEVTGYTAKDLGILLQVTPHVNDNGEITIDLAPMISDLLRYDTLDKASGIVAPVFSVRQAKTQLMIKDGDTIFIGGLIKENDIEIVKKVPIIGDFLADVPYLGLLVSRKETKKEKTELIFFVTVNLMATGKEIKDVPSGNTAYVPVYNAVPKKDFKSKKKIQPKKQYL